MATADVADVALTPSGRRPRARPARSPRAGRDRRAGLAVDADALAVHAEPPLRRRPRHRWWCCTWWRSSPPFFSPYYPQELGSGVLLRRADQGALDRGPAGGLPADPDAGHAQLQVGLRRGLQPGPPDRVLRPRLRVPPAGRVPGQHPPLRRERRAADAGGAPGARRRPRGGRGRSPGRAAPLALGGDRRSHRRRRSHRGRSPAGGVAPGAANDPLAPFRATPAPGGFPQAQSPAPPTAPGGGARESGRPRSSSPAPTSRGATSSRASWTARASP